MNPFVERHEDQIAGVLSCFDRVLVTGTLPDIGHAQAMAAHLTSGGIRLFDYPRWAQPLRDEIRNHAEQVAAEAGVEIEFVRSHKAFRKEQRIKDVLDKRGRHPGLVHVFSAMETCASFRPWHDKNTQRTSLKPSTSKCLHYYFYFIDEIFGLCYVRVPTWAPFRLQVYFNGHQWLARRLDKEGIAYELADNAFLRVADFERAQQLADRLDARQLHRRLDRWARRFCPVGQRFRSGYHWSLMQAEYATDVLFQRQADFQPLYANIVRTAVHTVQAEQVATFLGRKLTGAYQGEVGNDFSTRCLASTTLAARVASFENATRLPQKDRTRLRSKSQTSGLWDGGVRQDHLRGDGPGRRCVVRVDCGNVRVDLVPSCQRSRRTDRISTPVGRSGPSLGSSG